ncbi:MAG TPA: hypothetical protein VMG14_04990 [Thermoplasmata archaeon]|nr:hypothetical protein [Thermoplasmata archaeon]
MSLGAQVEANKMERMGPESLLLMAAAPIAFRTPSDDRALWEIPIEAEDRRPTLLLAAGPISTATRPDSRARGWWARLRLHPHA